MSHPLHRQQLARDVASLWQAATAAAQPSTSDLVITTRLIAIDQLSLATPRP